jgi:hypothetical protein
MPTTYDVSVWSIEAYKGTRATTYYVLWKAAGRRWKQSFKVRALAESFRAELMTASRRGEAFDVDTGRPVSIQRQTRDCSWYEHACAFADMKWPRVAATTRRTHAEALTAITSGLLTTNKGAPDAKLLRLALGRWGYNTARRADVSCPLEVKHALSWVEQHTRRVSELGRPEIVRAVLDGLTVRLDGKPAAASVVSRRRKIFNTAIEFAVERGFLAGNPLPALKWHARKAVHAVDRRSVANPAQARTLLAAVGEGPAGKRLVAFYGCLYFAALRPEEAVGLREVDLDISVEG